MVIVSTEVLLRAMSKRITIMTPQEIDKKHRLRAEEILETAQYFECDKEQIVELIAEGMQAVENNALGLVSVLENGSNPGKGHVIFSRIKVTDLENVCNKGSKEQEQAAPSDPVPSMRS
jgi:hypothetical protein